MVYANGDSVEKMSVSFDLDQLVEGIENKEPDSPRMKDGEYIEDECKFLPPPKSLAHPRLFYVRPDGTGMELCNEEQVRHMFRTNANKQEKGFIQRSTKVLIENEECLSHVFISKRQRRFDAHAFDVRAEFPKLPQSLELVNQTVSIPTEPVTEGVTLKNVKEFVLPTQSQKDDFHYALNKYHDLRAKERQTQEDLKIEVPVPVIKAVPYDERKDRTRGGSNYDGQSTMMGSQFSDQDSGLGSVGSGRRRLSKLRTKDMIALRQKQAQDDQGQRSEKQEDPGEVAVDEATGQLLMQSNLQLNFQQRLQLRIAEQRGIDVDTLQDEQFDILKQYKKLQHRERTLNNLLDFFD